MPELLQKQLKNKTTNKIKEKVFTARVTSINLIREKERIECYKWNHLLWRHGPCVMDKKNKNYSDAIKFFPKIKRIERIDFNFKMRKKNAKCNSIKVGKKQNKNIEILKHWFKRPVFRPRNTCRKIDRENIKKKKWNRESVYYEIVKKWFKRKLVPLKR